ncbi:ATP-binding protein [Bradyrhizobium sp. RDI18]|uniref:ATP-binding protein n=1 Tax=Bradyrhizobium sp. RDI18 TaxID=3367400 RepID=UPI003710BDC7
MLLNLVGNAIKFLTGARYRSRLRGSGCHAFTVAVRDTGPGIPADHQAKIFEEFAQADTSSTRKLADGARPVDCQGPSNCTKAKPGWTRPWRGRDIFLRFRCESSNRRGNHDQARILVIEDQGVQPAHPSGICFERRLRADRSRKWRGRRCAAAAESGPISS